MHSTENRRKDCNRLFGLTRYMGLLLLADEQESMIARYLTRGDLFVMRADDGRVVCVAVVTDEGGGVCELKNLAVAPCFQRRGYGKYMVGYLCRLYACRFGTMMVGTGDSVTTVSFYRSCGFEYSHSVAGFFTDNYDHTIVEDGKVLTDMLYFRKSLCWRRLRGTLRSHRPGFVVLGVCGPSAVTARYCSWKMCIGWWCAAIVRLRIRYAGPTFGEPLCGGGICLPALLGYMPTCHFKSFDLLSRLCWCCNTNVWTCLNFFRKVFFLLHSGGLFGLFFRRRSPLSPLHSSFRQGNSHENITQTEVE